MRPPVPIPNKPTITIQPIVFNVPADDSSPGTSSTHSHDVFDSGTATRQRDPVLYVPTWSLMGIETITSVRAANDIRPSHDVIASKMRLLDELHDFAVQRMGSDGWVNSDLESVKQNAIHTAHYTYSKQTKVLREQGIHVSIAPPQYYPTLPAQSSNKERTPSIDIIPVVSSEGGDPKVGFDLQSGSGLDWDIVPRFDDPDNLELLTRWRREQLVLMDLHTQLAQALKSLPDDTGAVTEDTLVGLADKVMDGISSNMSGVSLRVRIRIGDDRGEDEDQDPLLHEDHPPDESSHIQAASPLHRFSDIPLGERSRVKWHPESWLDQTFTTLSGSNHPVDEVEEPKSLDLNRPLGPRPLEPSRQRQTHTVIASHQTTPSLPKSNDIDRLEAAETSLHPPAPRTWSSLFNPVRSGAGGVAKKDEATIPDSGTIESSTRGRSPVAPTRPDALVQRPSWASIVIKGNEASISSPPTMAPQPVPDTNVNDDLDEDERHTLEQTRSSGLPQSLSEPRPREWAGLFKPKGPPLEQPSSDSNTGDPALPTDIETGDLKAVGLDDLDSTAPDPMTPMRTHTWRVKDEQMEGIPDSWEDAMSD